MNQIPNIEEIEALSEKIHHLYCAQYEKDHGEPYWTNGDYSKLDERTKEYDRNIARFINHQLQKAREEVLKEIDIGDNDYVTARRAVAELSGVPMMAITFDEHIKVIKEKLNHSELDQEVSK